MYDNHYLFLPKLTPHKRGRHTYKHSCDPPTVDTEDRDKKTLDCSILRSKTLVPIQPHPAKTENVGSDCPHMVGTHAWMVTFALAERNHRNRKSSAGDRCSGRANTHIHLFSDLPDTNTEWHVLCPSNTYHTLTRQFKSSMLISIFFPLSS